MSNKPVWLLDVDGVINAFFRGVPDFLYTYWPRQSWKLTFGEALGKDWPIFYSQDVIDFINSMADRVDIRWHTTWQKDAPGLGKVLGLKEFPVAELPSTITNPLASNANYFKSAVYDWWKMDTAMAVVHQEDRPLIWTDDDLVGYKHQFVLDTKAGHRGLLVSPYSTIGLVREDLDKIEQFVEEVESTCSTV